MNKLVLWFWLLIVGVFLCLMSCTRETNECTEFDTIYVEDGEYIISNPSDPWLEGARAVLENQTITVYYEIEGIKYRAVYSYGEEKWLP